MSAIEEFSELIAYVEELATPPVRQFITCQLMTGEQFEVEVLPRMSYLNLYKAIADRLPDGIHPKFIEQMNLMLEGEFIPWYCDRRVVPSSEVYHIILDTVSYNVSFEPVDTRNYSQHVEGMEYQCWECCVVQRNECRNRGPEDYGSIAYGPSFLYNRYTQTYLSLDDVEHDWSRCYSAYDDPIFEIWSTPEKPSKTVEEMFDIIVGELESQMELSLAGKHLIRQEVRWHLMHRGLGRREEEDEE